MDGKLMDESKPFSLDLLVLVAFSLKQYPTKKNTKRAWVNLCPSFNNKVFLKSNEKEHRKGISDWCCVLTTCFWNPTRRLNQYPRTNIAFCKQCVYFQKQFGWPTNVGPSLPFHPLHIILFYSSWVVPKVQKISRSIRALVFGKMRGGMNKEEIEKLHS